MRDRRHRPRCRCRPRRSSWRTTAVGLRRHAGGHDRGHARPAAPGPGRHLAATSLVAGPERAAAVGRADRAVRGALVSALPFLQRAALDPVASRTLRGKKAILASAPRRGSPERRGVEVPKLIEPRRISWVNLVLVLGHPDRRMGPHRRAGQRHPVVEHDHRGQVGLGGRRVRPGPGRLSGAGHRHRRLGHRHACPTAAPSPSRWPTRSCPWPADRWGRWPPGSGSSSSRATTPPWR